MIDLFNLFFSKNVLGNLIFYSAMNGSTYDKIYVIRCLNKHNIDSDNPIILFHLYRLKEIDAKTYSCYFY